MQKGNVFKMSDTGTQEIKSKDSRIPLIELKGIGKTFPGVRALFDMNLQVSPGSVHVICGENGAGKSTLMKIINGNYQPDSGEILLKGKKFELNNPIEAREHKI